MYKINKKLFLMILVLVFSLSINSISVFAADNSSKLSTTNNVTVSKADTSVSTNSASYLYVTATITYSSASDILTSVYVTTVYQGITYGGTLSLVTVTTGGGTYTGHYAGYLYMLV
jgi:hypothetical protein